MNIYNYITCLYQSGTPECLIARESTMLADVSWFTAPVFLCLHAVDSFRFSKVPPKTLSDVAVHELFSFRPKPISTHSTDDKLHFCTV